MESSDKSPSLDKYFVSDAPNSENFFDQLSSSSSSSSAMMNSFVQSKSNQSLFSTQDPATFNEDLSKLHLENKVEEPVVCKIFSDMSKVDPVKDKTFFDILSPVHDSEADGGSPSMINFDSNNEGPFPSPLQGFEDEFDPITGPETDRSREAWILSNATKEVLIEAATSQPGTFKPDRHLLTMPVVMLDELHDKLTQLIRNVFGEEEASKRKVQLINVPQDEKGLRELINNQCYKAAINLTSKLLTVYGQGFNRQNETTKHTTHSIQLWFTRLCLLVKISSYEAAYAESNIWWNLDRPDLYFQFYPEQYGGKLGTMVPFQMRLLIATIPAYVNNYSESLERLYSVLTTVRQILKNLDSGKSEDGSAIELSPKEREISKQVWQSREARVQHSIINVALMSKHYVLAIEVLQSLINKNKSINQKRALQSALGRIFLQLGDVTNAKKCFTIAKQLKRNQPGTLSSSTADLRELVDKGLFLVAEHKHKEAYDSFEKASMIDPTNIMVINNMAFCLLYIGQLKNAVNLLISTIKSNPSAALHEALLLNVCTLFELESSDLSQKEALLKEIAKYRGDGLNTECLKVYITDKQQLS